MKPYKQQHLVLFVFALLASSCQSFMHGYTWRNAVNQYHIVTGHEKNFGDRRLAYNKVFHRHSALSAFLDCKCNDRGLPQYIYEYQTPAKCRGIKLMYTKLDSVFVFEEPAKGKLQSVLKEARLIDPEERAFIKNALPPKS